MKIYLSPENRPGPHGPYTGYPGVYEHDVCCEIAKYEKRALERCGLSVTIADPGKGMAARCAEANAAGYDLYQTVHTNAGGGTGAECLYYGKPGGASYKANEAVYEALTQLYPSKRGLKDGNQFYENNQTYMVSVYPELAFHDNAKDATFLVEHKRELGEALAKGVCTYLKLGYKAPPTDSPNHNPQTGAGQLYYVQIGAFADKGNAEAYAAKARSDGYRTVIKREPG